MTKELTRGQVLRHLRDMAADPALCDGARGGVAAEQLADYFGVHKSTVKDRLKVLCESGKAARVYGMDPQRNVPRESYLPAEHPHTTDDSAPPRHRQDD
jgi:hypothetical protein